MKSFSSPDFISDLAIRYLNDGLLIESIALFELTKSLFPEYAPTYSYLGKILMEKNWDLDLAEEYLKNAIQLDPNFFESYNHLGKLFRINGNEKGLQQLMNDTKNLPRKPLFHLWLEYGFSLEERGNYRESTDIYKEILRFVKEPEEVEEITFSIERVQLKQEFS